MYCCLVPHTLHDPEVEIVLDGEKTIVLRDCRERSRPVGVSSVPIANVPA